MACSHIHHSRRPRDEELPVQRKFRHSGENGWPVQPCRRCGKEGHSTSYCSSRKYILTSAEYTKALYEQELKKLRVSALGGVQRRDLYQLLVNGNRRILTQAYTVLNVFEHDTGDVDKGASSLADLSSSWFMLSKEMREAIDLSTSWGREDRANSHSLRRAIRDMDRSIDILMRFMPDDEDEIYLMQDLDPHGEAIELLDDVVRDINLRLTGLEDILSELEAPVRLSEEQQAACQAKIAGQERLIAIRAAEGADECKVQ